MASFYDLKASYHQIRIPIKKYDLDSFAEHLPSEIRKANQDFVKNNPTLPGLSDYDARGYTEPEDERDCYAANVALSDIKRTMPYLEKMNEHLTNEQLSSKQYSRNVLHLAAECLQAEDDGLSPEAIDFMIDNSFEKDFGYFGCKHYEYNMCQTRQDFKNGLDFDEVKSLSAVPDVARQAVDFYMEKKGFEPEGIAVLSKAKDMGLAYGLYDKMVHGRNPISVKEADVICDIGNQIYDYAMNNNRDISKPGDEYKNWRVSKVSMEGYVDDLHDAMPLFRDGRNIDKEMLSDCVKTFLDKSDTRWFTDFLNDEKTKLKNGEKSLLPDKLQDNVMSMDLSKDTEEEFEE